MGVRGVGGSGRRRYRLKPTKTPDVTTVAPTADCDCSDSAALCPPVYRADLGPCAGAVGGDAPGPRPAHRDGGVAGAGAGAGAALRALPSGPESGALVGTARRAGPAGVVDRLDTARLAPGDRGGRDAGATQGRAHCRQGDVPRCGALQPQQGGHLPGVAMDLYGPAGAAALESAALGVAVSHPAGPLGAGQRSGRASPIAPSWTGPSSWCGWSRGGWGAAAGC